MVGGIGERGTQIVRNRISTVVVRRARPESGEPIPASAEQD
ncbi:hypothetical protein AB0K48_57790 [Nonomuraea sp. NPDC055795]